MVRYTRNLELLRSNFCWDYKSLILLWFVWQCCHGCIRSWSVWVYNLFFVMLLFGILSNLNFCASFFTRADLELGVDGDTLNLPLRIVGDVSVPLFFVWFGQRFKLLWTSARRSSLLIHCWRISVSWCLYQICWECWWWSLSCSKILFWWGSQGWNFLTS